MIQSTLRVLVVGAGIAGLAAARALRLAGFRPEVVERLPAPMPSVEGIFLPGNADRALRHLELDGPLRRLGQVIERQRFLDVSGRQLCEVDLGGLWAGVGDCRALSRSDLHEVLLDGAGGPVRHGVEVYEVRPGRYGVSVVFADGAEETYDLVVGADGPRSAVRTLAALGGPPRLAGQVAYRGVVDGGPEVRDWVAVLGQRAGFLVMPMGGGRLYCYADESGTEVPADPLARLRELFAGYGGPVPGVLDALRDVRVAPTDELDLGRWSHGRVVLVGDAAHATAPTLSQGAAMAVEDAVVLAAALRAGESVEEALRAYEVRRRPRAKWVRDRTHDRDRTRNVPPALRDPVLRGRGGRIFQQHYRLLLEPA
ncbi:FAD-dependent monooxygenase [Plantactinospora sp. KBS50]|uniref:FAD-dependent monooxygenase n=1 Tax=Plantactinospora sp. KBS50 TaxID=2024580 RepID=UPI000BAAF270|nr:FAD-dependent monooxygenase [Plantactinospora sp. KBS50]ASW53835.1 FAD-binding monooxygenase [Plantactinospora sp. KBS50]